MKLKLKGLLFLIGLLVANSTQAQNLKIHVDQKGKVGFADGQGNIVIKCEYESVYPFNNGVAIVTKSKKTGIIDESGKVLLPMKYDQISSWTDGLYLIKSGKAYGLASKTGTIVLPVKYSLISKPNCYGKALIALGGKATANNKNTYMANAKYGIIDNHGNIIIDALYKGLYEFSFDATNVNPYKEGFRLSYSYHETKDTLVTDCKYLGYNKDGYSIYSAGILDEHGKILLKMGLYDLVLKPCNNMVRYYNIKKKETLFGYYNIDTNKGFQTSKVDKVYTDIVASHYDFYGDVAPVYESSWSFLDKEGKIVRSNYSDIKHCKDYGLWGAKKSDQTWEVITENNEVVSSLSGFEDINLPESKDDDELYSVKKNGKYGVIDRSGTEVIPFSYEFVASNKHNFFVVKNNDKWGLVTSNNNVIVPIEYTDVALPEDKNTKHFWVMKSDSLFYHYNAEKGALCDKGYKSVDNFKDGLAYVSPMDINLENNEINKAQVYKPGTEVGVLIKANVEENKNGFGIIVDTEDNVIFDKPVSVFYKDEVQKRIIAAQKNKLTELEKRNILLEVTKSNRSYDLNSTLSEENWNY